MKKCRGCGKEWPNKTKFCGCCGTKLEETPVVAQDIIPEDIKEKKEQNKTEELVKTRTTGTMKVTDAIQPKKKSRKKVWKIVAAVVVVAAATTAVFLTQLGEKIEHPCVELYGDSYEIITKEKIGHTIEITDNALDWIDNTVMQLSPNRKYIYYMENYDTSTATARLYRCEYQKLSDKTEKNEKYKERIASNVSVYCPLEDDKVIYINKDSQLFYFDGEASQKIADSVDTYYKIKDGTGIVYLKGDYTEGFDAYGIRFEKPTEEIFLAEDITNIMMADDQEHIVCKRHGEDFSLVFMTGFEKEAEELGISPSDMYAWNDGVVYYFTLDENTVCKFEDFVIDSRGDTEEWKELEEYWRTNEFQSLYEYTNGKINKITDRDVEYFGEYKGNCILYADFNKFQPVDLAEVLTEVSEDDCLNDILVEKIFEQCLYIKSADRKNAVHITGEAVNWVNELYDGQNVLLFYMSETDVFLSVRDTFLHAIIQDDEINKFEEMPNGFIKAVTPGKIYYASNRYFEGQTSYYDINVCENGKSRCLATQVIENYAQIFEDGIVLAYTDVNSDREYELSIFDNKGKKTIIDDGVTQVIRKENGDILYNSHGDLMLYKNGESERIGLGVKCIWYADEMEAKQTFRLNW